MKRIITLVFIFFAAIPLSFLTPCRAEMLRASEMEALSTQCSDGTEVYGLYGNGVVSSRLYVAKNGRILYKNDDFEFIQHIHSITCTPNAIILSGSHGSYWGTVAITSENGLVKIDNLGGHRAPVRIQSSDGATSMDIYGDGRSGEEDRIVIHREEKAPFHVNSTEHEEKIRIDMDVTIQSGKQGEGRLSTIATCYSPAQEDDYTLAAYTDSRGQNHLALVNSYKIVHSKNNEYIAPLPFTATNSICVDGAIYLYGKENGKVQAVKVFYDDKTVRHIETVEAEELPVRLW